MLMKTLMIMVLFAAFGCATHRAPEPAQPQADVRPTAPPAERAAVSPAERPSPAVAPPASPKPEMASQQHAVPPQARQPEESQRAVELSSRPAAPVPPSPPPAEEEKRTRPLSYAMYTPPPAPTSHDEEDILPPAPQQPRARTPRESPVPDHRLQQLSELAADNDERLLHVFVGMYRKTVDKIMGSERKPYRRRTIMGTDGQSYEVIFYLTREPRQGRMINDRMLTPVIFKQGKVAAMGNYQLKKLNRMGTLDRPKLITAAPQ